MRKITKNWLLVVSVVFAVLFGFTACKEADNSKKTTKPDEKWTYTVTFNKNFDGTLESEGDDWTEANPKTISVKSPATTVGTLPAQPFRPTSGYQFVQWTIEKDGGAQFKADTEVTANIEVFAQWVGPDETLPIIGDAAIEGFFRIGEVLTVITDEIENVPETGDFIYQWKAGDIDIDGANEETYTIQEIDAGLLISCVITHSDTTGVITAIGEIVPYNISGTAEISGESYIVGSELTVTIGEIENEPEEGDIVYQWYSDEDAVGEDSDTYTIASGDVGKVISCIITHSGADGEITATGEEVANTIVGEASIAGLFRIGEELTIVIDKVNYTPEDGEFEYQWKADDEDIDGANGSAYTIFADDAEKVISCIITHSDADCEIIAAGEVVPRNISGTAHITGTYRIGGELVVHLDHEFYAPGVQGLIYQWKADGVNIANSNNATYTVKSGDAGKVISCVITHRDTGGEIAATGLSVLFNISGTASITGTYKIGERLTVVTSSIEHVPAGNFIYQWKADNDEIEGAESQNYIITGLDAGKVISCFITHSGTNGSVTAAGAKVPYTIELRLIDNEPGDRVSFHAANDITETTGHNGDVVTIHYTLARTKDNNQLELNNEEKITAIGPGTKTYTVNAASAMLGEITIDAEFTHTNLQINHISFADNQNETKTYGDGQFTKAITNTGSGTGAITYVSSHPDVADVNNSGVVTILKRGTTTITATKASDGTWELVNARYELEVVPKNVTITGLGASDKVYNGNTTAAITGTAVVNGRVGSDTVSVITGTARFIDKNIGSNKTVNFDDFTLGNNADGNYHLERQPNSVTANITPLQLTVSGLTAESKVYDGDNSASIHEGWTDNSIAEDSLIIFDTATFNDKNAGDGKPVTVTFEIFGAAAGNYIKPADVNLTADITKLQLTVSGLTAASRPYNGNTGATVPTGWTSNKITADDLTITPAAEFVDKNASNGKQVDVTFAISGTDAVNYVKPADTSVTANITALQLAMSNPNLTTSKPYDANTSAAFTMGSITNKQGSDDVSVTAIANYNNKSAGTGNKTITVVYTMTGADSSNYLKPVDYVVTTGTISQLQLTMSNPTVTSSKLYDGNNTAASTIGSINNKQGTDDVSVTAAATYDSKNAGTNNKTVTVVYTMTGADSSNYVKPVNYTVSNGTISQLQLTVSGLTVEATKVYNGNNSAAITNQGTNNKIAADTLTITPTATYNDKTAVNGKPITVTFDITGADAGNYIKPANITGLTADITKLQLTVSGLTVAATRVYDSTAVAAITNQGTNNRITTDNITITPTATYNNKTVGTGKQVTVSFALGGTDIANYIAPANITNLTANITALQLTISAPTATAMTYSGSTNAASVVTIGTLQNKFAIDTVTPAISSATFNNATAGSSKTITVVYSISGTDSGNYTAPANGTINNATINKAAGSAINAVPTVNGTPTPFTIAFNAATLSTATGQGIEYAISTSGTSTPANDRFSTGASMDPQFTFTGLTADTPYFIWARSADSTNYNIGTARASSSIRTSVATGSALLNGLWWSEAHIKGSTKWSPGGTTVNTPGVLFIDGNKFWDLSDWGWAHKGDFSVSGSNFTTAPTRKKDGNAPAWEWKNAVSSDTRTVSWSLSNNNNTLSVTITVSVLTHTITFQRTTWDSTDAVNGTGPAAWNGSGISWQKRITDDDLDTLIKSILRYGWNDANTEFKLPPVLPTAADGTGPIYSNATSGTRDLFQPIMTGRNPPAVWATDANGRITIRSNVQAYLDNGQYNQLQGEIFRKATHLVIQFNNTFTGNFVPLTGTGKDLILQWVASGTPIWPSSSSASGWQYHLITAAGSPNADKGVKYDAVNKRLVMELKYALNTTGESLTSKEGSTASNTHQTYAVFAGANTGSTAGINEGGTRIIIGYRGSPGNDMRTLWAPYFQNLYLVNIVN